MDAKISVESFGNSFLGIVIGLILAHLAFLGEPDVIDALIAVILRWAGLSPT